MLESGEDLDQLQDWSDDRCCACDRWERVDDLGLREECWTKVERDLVLQRDWVCSAWALGLLTKGERTCVNR